LQHISIDLRRERSDESQPQRKDDEPFVGLDVGEDFLEKLDEGHSDKNSRQKYDFFTRVVLKLSKESNFGRIVETFFLIL
jgi:hypothetical protein